MQNDKLKYMEATNVVKYWSMRAVQLGKRLYDADAENADLRARLKSAEENIETLNRDKCALRELVDQVDNDDLECYECPVRQLCDEKPGDCIEKRKVLMPMKWKGEAKS